MLAPGPQPSPRKDKGGMVWTYLQRLCNWEPESVKIGVISFCCCIFIYLFFFCYFKNVLLSCTLVYLKLVPHRHLFSVRSPWARRPRGPSGGQALSGDERGRRPHAHTCMHSPAREGWGPEHREGTWRRRRGRAPWGVGRRGIAALGPGLQGRGQKSPANLLSVEIHQWRGAMAK